MHEIKRTIASRLLAFAVLCSVSNQVIAGELYLLVVKSKDSLIDYNIKDDDDNYNIVEKASDIFVKDMCNISLIATDNSIKKITVIDKLERPNFMGVGLFDDIDIENILVFVEDLDPDIKEQIPTLKIGSRFFGTINNRKSHWLVKEFKLWPSIAATFNLHRHIFGHAKFVTINAPLESIENDDFYMVLFPLEKDSPFVGKEVVIDERCYTIKFVAEEKPFSPRPVILESDGRLEVKTMDKLSFEN